MALLQEHISLKNHNTFGVEAQARWFAEIKNETDLSVVFADERVKALPLLVIGGGSNMLFTQNFEGLVLWMHNQGIGYVEQGEEVLLTAAFVGVILLVTDHQAAPGFAGLAIGATLYDLAIGLKPLSRLVLCDPGERHRHRCRHGLGCLCLGSFGCGCHSLAPVAATQLHLIRPPQPGRGVACQ
jgi:hypothetical protein